MANLNNVSYRSAPVEEEDPFFIDTTPMPPSVSPPKISYRKPICMIASSAYGKITLLPGSHKVTRRSAPEGTLEHPLRKSRPAPYFVPSTSKNPFKLFTDRCRESSEEPAMPIFSPTQTSSSQEKNESSSTILETETTQKKNQFGPYGCNLYISLLPEDFTDEDIIEMFQIYGTIIGAKVYRNKLLGQASGFVSFDKPESAKAALEDLKNADKNALNLEVTLLESQLSYLDLDSICMKDIPSMFCTTPEKKPDEILASSTTPTPDEKAQSPTTSNPVTQTSSPVQAAEASPTTQKSPSHLRTKHTPMKFKAEAHEETISSEFD